MNAPRVTETDRIDFLLATPTVPSATEAQRVQPPGSLRPAPDAFTRLLPRLEPDPQTLGNEVRPLVVPPAGVLVLEDSTLDKP
jgi:putative transposase